MKKTKCCEYDPLKPNIRISNRKVVLWPLLANIGVG